MYDCSDESEDKGFDGLGRGSSQGPPVRRRLKWSSLVDGYRPGKEQRKDP